MGNTREWWAARRLRYNVGVILASVAALVVTAALMSSGACEAHDPEGLEITLFTISFQVVAFAVGLSLANVAYLLGPGVERLIRPRNVKLYRKIAFGLGFGFSTALPFVLPAFALFC